MTGYDGITAYVETSIDARFLDPLDLDVTIGEKDGKRTVKWTPNFRFIDTATVTPDPETQKMVDRFKTELDKKPQCRDRHDRRAARFPPQRRAQARKLAMGDLDRRRHEAPRRAPTSPSPTAAASARDRTYDAGTSLTRARHPDRAALRQQDRDDRNSRQPGARRARERLQPGRERRRPLPAGLRHRASSRIRRRRPARASPR